MPLKEAFIPQYTAPPPRPQHEDDLQAEDRREGKS